MTKKPSLYVIERREVIVLVIIFLLVGVLAFTVGVKYGTNLGRKTVLEKQEVQQDIASQKSIAGGSLGEHGPEGHTKDEHGSAEAAAHGSHGDAEGAHSENAHGEIKNKEAPKDEHAAVATEKHVEEHGKTPAPAHDAPEAHGAEQKSAPEHGEKMTAKKMPSSSMPSKKKSEEPNTDEYLVNALKEAGLDNTASSASKEKPAPSHAAEASPPETLAEHSLGEEEEAPAASESVHEKLPSDVKGKGKHVSEKSYYVIQVASYPNEADAEEFASELKNRKLAPKILRSMDSEQGTWYRVAIGQYSDKAKAMALAKQYKARGLIQNYFVRRVN